MGWSLLLLAVLAGAWAPRRLVPPSPLCGRSHHPLAASRLGFDLPTATILAGYAFEAYNEPSVGKRAVGGDGTVVVFTSPKLIRRVFQGVLQVTVGGARINRGWQARQRLLERVPSPARRRSPSRVAGRHRRTARPLRPPRAGEPSPPLCSPPHRRSSSTDPRTSLGRGWRTGSSTWSGAARRRTPSRPSGGRASSSTCGTAPRRFSTSRWSTRTSSPRTQ